MDPETERILLDALRREGWPQPAAWHQADLGGWTRGGITATNWGDYRRLGRPARVEELNAITLDEALDFYFTRYVRRPGYDAVWNLPLPLRALLVDWAFTSWFDDPTKALQRALRAHGYDPGPVDGILGPRTRAALRAERDPARLYREVFVARVRFYLDLSFDAQVKAFLLTHPTTQLLFCKGWIYRALEFAP